MSPGSPSSSTCAAAASSTTCGSPSPISRPDTSPGGSSSWSPPTTRWSAASNRSVGRTLQGDGRIVDGIAAERELLRELRGDADLVIDTSSLNVHELRAKMDAQFAGDEEPELRATVMSFGFKYGLPVDADLVADCRFLPNPHWVPELRPFTGLNEEVSAYVFNQPGAKEFLNQYTELLQLVAAGYRREGKRYVTIAVGCTGGKHRSVAMSEKLAARLAAEGIETVLVHRDMGRE